MSHVIGSTSKCIILQAIVDAELGYPKWGVNAETNEPIMPSGGQRVEDVPGVTLHYADVIPKFDNADLASYELTSVNAAAAATALNDARLFGLTEVEELPEGWLPSLLG